MKDDLLRDVASDLNAVPASAERAARHAGLVADTNTRIAEAARAMPFDSTPYSMQQWLAAIDKPGNKP